MTVAAPVRIEYEPRGAVLDAFYCHDPEVVIAGPAGTGKTRGGLEKVHLCAAHRYPGMRGALLRKTARALTATTLVSYQEKVLHPDEGVVSFGGSASKPPGFRYPNGSFLAVGGMDDPAKILGGEYDIIYVSQAEDLTENEWETLLSRLRNGVMPYQQLLADCNPATPTHWLRLRSEKPGIDGRPVLTMLNSRHQDNPVYWDDRTADWTTAGRQYVLSTLGSLTGVRRLRLLEGKWAAAEGVVYEGWDPDVHVIDRFPVPDDWARFWTVDFGYIHPFVWQEWRMDGDGRLYRTKEIHMSQRLVADHALDIARAVGAKVNPEGPQGRRIDWADVPRPQAIVCDHDAEDRATLERELRLDTIPARKAISDGVQAVAARLKVQADGRPRLFLVRDALVEVDRLAETEKRPLCTEQEIEGYVWPSPNAVTRPADEVPVKRDDDGLDATRYGVMYADRSYLTPAMPDIASFEAQSYWRSA